MKTTVMTALVVLAASAAHAQTTPPPASPQTQVAAPAAVPQTLSVDDLIAKYLESKGGLDTWKTIQTQKMTGTATGDGFQLGFVIYTKRPNLVRQDLSLEVPGQPTMTIVTLVDGEKAWKIDPVMGTGQPEQLTGNDAISALDQSDFDGPLIDYKAKGSTVTLMEPAMVAGKSAHHLRVTRVDMPTQHIYLDPETFVELRITTEGAAPTDTELSDYREVDGVKVPYVIKIKQGTTVVVTMTMKTVEFNTALEDSLFKVK